MSTQHCLGFCTGGDCQTLRPPRHRRRCAHIPAEEHQVTRKPNVRSESEQARLLLLLPTETDAMQAHDYGVPLHWRSRQQSPQERRSDRQMVAEVLQVRILRADVPRQIYSHPTLARSRGRMSSNVIPQHNLIKDRAVQNNNDTSGKNEQ